MITEKDVLQALAAIPGPDGKTPLPQSGAISGLTTVGGKVYLSIEIDASQSMAAEPMRLTAEQAIKGLAGVSGASVTLTSARAQGQAQGQVRIARGNDVQTLLVRITAETGGEGGYVLTFDDISQQLSDQRRAAWSDVARRIAHEIKNPLTPIQLSAERLQRRYGRHITQDPETFETLTSTIVRQVGDLRRMVDEFSSFARMPKPVFRLEPVLDMARQALFLHEVAHPNIRFTLAIAPDLPLFMCDRRQIAQALINLLKNAVEAVEARGTDFKEGHILLDVRQQENILILSISDNGIGIPPELRERITEPYVTSRARGTGLGLAIVKKIVEEHEGALEIESDAQSGTTMRMRFDLSALEKHINESSREFSDSGSDKMMKA